MLFYICFQIDYTKKRVQLFKLLFCSKEQFNWIFNWLSSLFKETHEKAKLLKLN